MPMRSLARKITGHRLFLEHLGWYCTAVFLAAYFMASAGIVSANSLIYQLLNLSGALGYTYYAHKKKVYPSVFANLIWALVGAFAVISIVF